LVRQCRTLGVRHHVGPVNWEVFAADYDFWKRVAAAQKCAAAYLQKIERLGKGIILMHDSSEDEAMRLNNWTPEMTQLMVPIREE
jgi:hypothetical protein